MPGEWEYFYVERKHKGETMKVRNWLTLGILGLAMIGLNGCDAVSQAWYDVYGSECGSNPRPGCNFYSNGDKISYEEDSYYGSLDLIYGRYVYTDSYGYSQTYYGWVRSSPDGILYDEYGYALNSNESHGRDVVTNAAAARKAVVRGAAQRLQAKYGLSANTSMNIATSLNDWAMIGKTRKRTDADVAAFTKRLYGLKVSELNAAMSAHAAGNDSLANQAISKAAKNWSTSPDTMKRILKDWYKQQIN
jgi:hypothetical protein